MKKTEIFKTEAGKIQGYIEDGIYLFKGIPYTEPPIGKLRFNEPVLKESWEGVLHALEFGPEAPQHISPLTPQPYPKQDEANCLTLNIWTPGVDNEERPIMVWIHGGGFREGSGSRFDVLPLVRRGNVVLITLNYRLGPLANLVLPDVPGNLDMLDQASALKWIHNNITSFGGDPQKVTIFGESAGGQSVCILMAVPKAKGLFHRVISQSGRAMPQGYKFNDRKATTKWLLEELNLKTYDLEGLRKASAEKIIKASDKVRQKATASGMWHAFGPFIDDNNLPEHPLKAVNKGFSNEVELIIGSNREEWKFFHMFNPNNKEIDSDALPRLMGRALKYIGEPEDKADSVIEIYQKSRKEQNLSVSPQDILDAFNTDSVFRIPAIKFAEAHSKYQKNTYMYLFSWPSKFRGGIYGAMHGLEIAFVFNRFLDHDRGFNPKRTQETELLSGKIMDAWASFAKSGNPNHRNIPNWPQYNIPKRSTLVFDNQVEIWEDPMKNERELWDEMSIWKNFF
ncbi:MAG: carboxylesterase/lipase family protein [Candidatus Thorarchaeota archaeon]